MFWSKILPFMAFVVAAFVITAVALTVVAEPAASQQMGREAYKAPARTPSLAAQFSFQERMQKDAQASSAAGMSAVTQYVTTHTSNSTSVGNMNQITQILSEGSEATIDQRTDQATDGNQGSEATTRLNVINDVPPPTTTSTRSLNGSRP